MPLMKPAQDFYVRVTRGHRRMTIHLAFREDSFGVARRHWCHVRVTLRAGWPPVRVSAFVADTAQFSRALLALGSSYSAAAALMGTALLPTVRRAIKAAEEWQREVAKIEGVFLT